MKDLDSLFRADARSPIADEGFTGRVLAALPPREAVTQAWFLPALVIGAGALGAALAVAFAPAGSSLLQGFIDVMMLRLTPPAVAALAMGGALLASALVVAFSSE